MRRGELYRVHQPHDDPKLFRVFVVVSRQELIDSGFQSVICAPIFSRAEGLFTQIPVGIKEGLKHSSWILCDNLISIRKAKLTQFVGSLSAGRLSELNEALRLALDLI